MSRVFAALIGVALCTGPASAADGLKALESKEEQQLLSQLDQEVIKGALDIVKKVKEWRGQLLKIKQAADKVSDIMDEPVTIDVAKPIFEIADQLAKLAKDHPQLAAHLAGLKKVEDILKKADVAWQSARFDPEIYFDLTEAGFRDEVKALARNGAAAELRKLFDVELFTSIEKLRNPIQFAKDFGDQEISKWLQEPREVGGLKFTIKKADPKQSFFSPKTEVTIKLAYAGKVTVEATGLYFRYIPKAPFWEPVLDGLKVQTNLKALAVQNLASLGEDALADLNLPIGISNFEFTDFAAGKAALKCDLEVGLGELLPVKAKGKLKLFSNGKVELDSALKIKHAFTSPLPLGTTPLGIHEIEGEIKFEGKSKTVTAAALISTAAKGTDKALALDVELSFTLPFKSIGLKGRLLLGGKGGLCLGAVQGDFGPKGIDLKLTMPGPGAEAIKAVAAADARVTLTRERLTADGKMTLYSAFQQHFDLVINNDGSGRFCADAGGKVLGVSARGEVTAAFKAGFSDLVVRLNTHVEIDLGDLLQADVVGVEIEATRDRIAVTAHGFGISVKFNIRSDQNLKDELVREFKKVLDRAIELIAKALAQCDPFNKNSFAAYATRNLDPFNKNSATARVAREFDPTNKNSAAARVLRKYDPGTILKDAGISIPAPTASDVEDFFSTGGGLWGHNGRYPRLHQAALLIALTKVTEEGGDETDFARRLAQAVVSLQDISVQESLRPVVSQSPAGRAARGSSAHARVLAPVLTSVDENQFLIGFVIKTNGVAYTLRPGKDERLTGSEAVGGSIILSRQPGGRWKGKLNLPKFAWSKYCYQDLSLHLSQQIEHRLEHLLPEVDIEGLRLWFEKKLALENRTKQELTVHVQRRTLLRVAPKPQWAWLPDADPGKGKAFRLVLKPGDRVTLSNRLLGPGGDDNPVSASRVRIWAESEDGDRWDEQRDHDLWLVAENPRKNNERVYQAEEMATHTHTFRPRSGPGVYGERIVAIRNETDKPLTVRLSYLATVDGQQRWRTLPDFEVGDHETVRPRDPDGCLVRAAAVKVRAANDEFGYREHATKPLWLVDEVDGRRMYRAPKIGSYTHTFKPVPAASGTQK